MQLTTPHQSSADIILGLARSAGSAGICTAEIAGFEVNTAHAVLRRLAETGHLFRGKIGHRTVRYFASAEWAEAYGSSRRTRVSARQPGSRWSAAAPAHYPTDASGRPAYKVTLCPPCRLGEGRLIRSGFGVFEVRL